MHSQSKALVRDSGNLSSSGSNEVGGKALNLYRLKQMGLNVAPFFVVTTEAFAEHIDGITSEIQTRLREADLDQPASITRVSQSICGLMKRKLITGHLSRLLSDAVRRAFHTSTRLAVRSSAIDEDSAESSFAGMMDSFLNVAPERLEKSILKVWQSAYSERALAYRLRKNCTLDGIAVAVIVQEFISTAVSGVMFTSQPDGDGSVTAISAGYGLGEGIVSGGAETDMFLLSKNGDKITADVSVKRRRVEACSNGGGTKIVAVPRELADLPALPTERLRQLKGVGQAVERELGGPQDVEWGYDETGRLFVMQARAITSDGKPKGSESTHIWHNANIIESYPGLTLPLTFSFILRNYEVLFRKAACGLVLRPSRLRKRSEIWRNMLGLVRGRVYYNLDSWYGMLSHLPGFNRFQRTWNRAMGINQETGHARTHLSTIDTLYTICRIILLLLTVRRSARRFFHRCDRALALYRERDFSKANESEIIRCYRSLENDLLGFWNTTLYNDLCAMTYYDLLRRTCRRWNGSDQGGLHHELLRNADSVESIKPLRALMRISRLIERDDRYRGLLTMNNVAAWEAIRSDATYAVIRNVLDEYIVEYGDRCFDELKLESRTYREQPEELIGLIRAYAAGPGTESSAERNDDVKNSVEVTLGIHIRNPLKRIIAKVIAYQARCAITNRENMRFARTRVYGVVRRMFRQLGKLMQQKGVLTHSEDIFYLTVDEAFGAILGTGVTANLSSLVELRKSEYAMYASQELPCRFTTEHYPSLEEHSPEQTPSSAGNRLTGIGCSGGTATGRARIITDPRVVADCRGCVLITRTTDPSWVFLMASARGIVAERGSVLSHTAIVGRELGIPTVVGVEGAFSAIPEGAVVTINGASGSITWR